MITGMMMAAAMAAQGMQGEPAHPAGHSQPVTAPDAGVSADEAAVRAVLARYKSAIENLDAAGTEALFTSDAAVFETGGVEGTYSQYLAHHLGPELAAFRAFKFSNYKVSVRFEGPVALATETYDYRIETKSGEVAERKGVATSVLTRIGGVWRIVSMHSSARKPKKA